MTSATPFFSLPARPYEQHEYSPAIRSGDLLFASGHVDSREDGIAELDFGELGRLAFRNVSATLVARPAL